MQKHFVTAGLDPVVHADVRRLRSLSANPIVLLVRMDCRIKSGNDEEKKGRRNADRRVILPSAPSGA